MPILFLFISLLFYSLNSFAEQSDVDSNSFNIKIGTLEHDETWQGDIYLVGDVIVPKGVQLIIEPGTRLFYAEYDISKAGNDPEQTEIIVNGELYANSTDEQPILVTTIGEARWKQLNDGDQSIELNFKPYQIDTEPMREEFHQFKKQYLVLWSLIYAMWILAL